MFRVKNLECQNAEWPKFKQASWNPRPGPTELQNIYVYITNRYLNDIFGTNDTIGPYFFIVYWITDWFCLCLLTPAILAVQYHALSRIKNLELKSTENSHRVYYFIFRHQYCNRVNWMFYSACMHLFDVFCIQLKNCVAFDFICNQPTIYFPHTQKNCSTSIINRVYM